MRILTITDAWQPQVNGVVRTLLATQKELLAMGHEVALAGPGQFHTIPCPTYPEIRLALRCGTRLRRILEAFAPDSIHIATEGPLGMAGRRYCVRRGIPFSTAYHTRFPEYVHARFRIPLAFTYAFLRWFHRPSSSIMVSTLALKSDLEARGFRNIKLWSRGVDTALFHPRDKSVLDLTRPIFLYVGRVAIEKNIEAFLKLDLPGSRVVIGDGPLLEELKAKYPAVRFLGMKSGEDLAAHYAASDVFVFPSRTDTFGLVLLEALASGVPVAAYPEQAPRQVIGAAPVGCLNEDLKAAALAALSLSPGTCRDYAMGYSWRACTGQFVQNLVSARLNAMPVTRHLQSNSF